MNLWAVLALVLAVALVAAIGAAVWLYRQRQRSERLRAEFGPEYDRVLTEHRDRRRAESELEARQERVEKLRIHPLSSGDQARFADEWKATQARFVDEPAQAITAADRLVTEVMQRRGYPMGDFEQRAADVSVDHPRVVENYRAARALALRNERGEASTEDLRQAMMHYRTLFTELLERQETQRMEGRR